jgi:hypothetical protein
MTKFAEPHADTAAPARPVSMEITPAEFDSYMSDWQAERAAQRLRSEAMAGIVERWFAGFAGLFSRSRRLPVRGPALGDAD